MRLTRKRRRSRRERAVDALGTVRSWPAGRIAAAGGLGLAAITALRRFARRRPGRLKGAALDATAPLRHMGREYDDVTLARKVESEIFRDADAPKGKVNVNAVDGVVELRGQVEGDQIAALARAAARVDGVKSVTNLLHPPGTPAPAAESRFAREAHRDRD